MDPVPSPELSPAFSSFEVEVAVGEVEVPEFEARTVTTTTVGEPSDPVLWMLLSCWGGGVAEVRGGGVVEEGSCSKVEGDCEVVGVELGVSFGGADGCEGLLSGDVVALVGVGETGTGTETGVDDGIGGEIEF